MSPRPQGGDRRGENSSQLHRLSRSGTRASGGAAKGDRRECFGPRTLVSGAYIASTWGTRPCPNITSPVSRFRRSSPPACPGASTSCTRRHRFAQHRLHGVLPAHAGRTGGCVFTRPGGASVTVKVFINSPYDKFVTQDTKFLAGKRRRHVDRLRGRETAYRIDRLHPRRRSGLPVPQGLHLDPEAAEDSGFSFIPTGSGDARDRHRGGDVHHVLSRIAAWIVGGAPVDLRGINIGEVQTTLRRVRSGGRRAALSGRGRHFSAANPRPGAHAHAKNSDFSDMGGHTMIDSMWRTACARSSRTATFSQARNTWPSTW